MRALRGLLNAVLGILAALLWFIGGVLCVTVIPIPQGLPVIRLARRPCTLAGRLMHLP
jgi:hypothetical protein